MRSNNSKLILAFIFVVFYLDSYAADFKNIPDHFKEDIQNSFFSNNTFIFLGTSLASGITYFKDDNISFYLEDHHLFNNNFNKTMDYIGKSYSIWAFDFSLYGIGALTHKERLQRLSEILIESQLIKEVSVLALKYTFRRTRPNGENLSFPSGHAANLFTLATCLFYSEGYYIGIPAYMFATLMALSRVDYLAHYPSDVIFGAGLGITIGLGVSIAHKYKSNNYFILPIVVENKVGLGITFLSL
jgi:membrane-associated phospholipid phosphatase